MKFMPKLRMLTSTSGCLFLFSLVLHSQTYSFKNYGVENNIRNGSIYTIDQSDDGFLWIGTGSGLTLFDGYNFAAVAFPDSAMRYTTSSLKDKNGTLWFGCSDGSVFYAKKHNLVQARLPNEKIISKILEGSDGFIWVVPQGKSIFRINATHPEEVLKYNVPDNPVLWTAAFAGGKRMLAGTQENIVLYDFGKDTITVPATIEGFDYTNVTAIIQTTDTSDFIVGTDGNGLFRLHLTGKEYKLSRFAGLKEMESISVQSLMKDSENNLWVSTKGNGTIQLIFSGNFGSIKSAKVYSSKSGLPADDVRTVFQDIEGNYWIGTLGYGISMLPSDAVGFYTPGRNPVQNNIIYVNSVKDKYLLGTPSGFHLFDAEKGQSVSFTDLSGVTGNTEITCYLIDKDNNLWIGTAGNGLYQRNSSGSVRRFYRSGDSGADYIRDIEAGGQNIWLATTNGVIVLDRITGIQKQKFDINNGLPHNSINKILLTDVGKAYIGTESDRLYTVDSNFNIVQGNGIMYGSTINKVLAFAMNKKGTLWAATKSNGIFRFSNDSVSAINTSNDLMSNYCYSIFSDSENDIWIGHENGFSRYNPEKKTFRIFGTDYVKAGVCNPGGMFESADHKIMVGTTSGLVIYDMLKERKKEMAPFTNINYITINDVRYDYQPSFTLPYNKKYVIKINYTGICFSNPGKVFYSTFLENYDNDWSKLTTSREVPYSLSDGKYKFNLISFNEDASLESSVSFNILIRQPFWRTWWFILLAIGALSGAVLLIIRQREKAQKKIQEYLETELNLRTREVVKQKAEIELQNLEITDSINYAKRIQSSILPDINKLKEFFRDAFILFQPRDIVSGDYYWFDRIDNDRFILVCADSTGHGVPGAFMSMIGSTLLQDIVTRKMVTRPSEILKLLDRQIFSTLNQNVELGVSNDGMDMVVCEFNLKTRHLRFASAMRPVIIIMDGESYYIKGNRSSIGGESVNEKFFDDQEYYLKENDSIYLFSDGLSDQFGGPEGKKMKIAKLKRTIEQLTHLPMDQQKEEVLKFYHNWRGSFDQVDDILLMGVKM